MDLKRALFRLLLLMAGVWPLAVMAEDVSVWLALSEADGPYLETANAIRDELASSSRRPELRIGPWRELLANPGKPPQLIVTVGGAAYRGIIEEMPKGSPVASVPLLATLLPRNLYESLPDNTHQPTSAVFLDQPLVRFLDLLRLALPERKHVGVVLGTESAPLAASLTKAAAARGMQVVVGRMAGDKDLYPALRSVLGDADVLLALPDGQVYNTGSLQNILISTYRQGVPVVAFAPGYVRAGATLALYSSPEQAGRQAAVLIKGFIAGRGLPAPQMADDFLIGVNDRVARSMGLSIDNPEALAAALRRLEAQR